MLFLLFLLFMQKSKRNTKINIKIQKISIHYKAETSQYNL